MTDEHAAHEADMDRLTAALGRSFLRHGEMTLHLQGLHRALCGMSAAAILATHKETRQLIDECRRMVAVDGHVLTQQKSMAALDEASSLNARRNQYAHGMWMRAYDDKPGGRGELLGVWTVIALGKGKRHDVRTVDVEHDLTRYDRVNVRLAKLTLAYGPLASNEDRAALEDWE